MEEKPKELVPITGLGKVATSRTLCDTKLAVFILYLFLHSWEKEPLVY